MDCSCPRNGSAKRSSRQIASNPDIIALTGDFVTYSRANIEPAAEILGRLRARYGVFAVLGNHDFRVDADADHAGPAPPTNRSLAKPACLAWFWPFVLVLGWSGRLWLWRGSAAGDARNSAAMPRQFCWPTIRASFGLLRGMASAWFFPGTRTAGRSIFRCWGPYTAARRSACATKLDGTGWAARKSTLAGASARLYCRGGCAAPRKSHTSNCFRAHLALLAPQRGLIP